jgi:hypothetical protein
MADETQLYCKQCNRNVLAKRKGTSHIFHLIMTIFTAGLWLLVWLGQSIKVGGWRCAFCGGTKLERSRA